MSKYCPRCGHTKSIKEFSKKASTKDVDGGKDVPWRGYNHHRYIVWNDGNALHILPKFPIIEHITFEEDKLQKFLENPFNWCTFYHFKDEVKYKFYHMGRDRDFVMFDGSYLNLINKAITISLNQSMNQMRKIGII